MKNVLEKLNWALLMSHRAYSGRPPSSYRKALRSLITISMNPQDRFSDGLEAKLDAALQAIRNPNANDGLATVNSLQDLVNAVETQRDDQIQQTNANALTTAGRKVEDS